MVRGRGRRPRPLEKSMFTDSLWTGSLVQRGTRGRGFGERGERVFFYIAPTPCPHVPLHAREHVRRPVYRQTQAPWYNCRFFFCQLHILRTHKSTEVNTIFWPFDHPAQVDIASYLSACGITTFCDLCDLLNLNIALSLSKICWPRRCLIKQLFLQ